MPRTRTSDMPRDPYEVLGVGPDASEQQIKTAFRVLARELHPDVHAHDPAAEEKFKQAAEAYEILSDSERRAIYDRYGHEGLSSGGYAPNFDGFSTISDLFEAFFGGGAFGARAGPAQGQDAAAAVEVSLLEAARGTTVEVAFDAVVRCEHCRGKGAGPLAALGTELQVPTLDGSTSLRLSPGTQPGEVLTLRGEGMPSLRRGRHGDLRVIVNVVVPRRLSDEQRELLERLNSTLGSENLRSDESLFAKLRRVLGSQPA